MIDVQTISVGTDAEVPIFLLDGTPFPVTGLVGGTKAEPIPLGKLGPGFMLQEDNVMLEFNIPPATAAAMFQKNIHKALGAISKELPPTMEYRVKSHANYKPEFLDNPYAKAFGCEPDFNAYTLEENPRPKSKNPNLRTAAAHVHVGWESPTKEDRIHMVKMMDLTVCLSFLRIEDKTRKEMYGKAGAFRPKKYGIEHRSCGNGWILEYAEHMFGQVVHAAKLVNAGTKLSAEDEKVLVESINSCELTGKVVELASKYGVWVI